MTAQLPALKSLAIPSTSSVNTAGAKYDFVASNNSFLPKLVDIVRSGRYIDRSLSQSLPALGTCQVLVMMSGIKVRARSWLG